MSDEQIDPNERFLRALLILGTGAQSAARELLARETERRISELSSPYQGHPGQRPGESFTAYRIRVRKEQQA